MFLFKKLISPLLFPVPAIWMLLAVGVLLLWRGKRQHWGRRLAAAALLLLTVCSLPLVPEWAMRRLERRYPAYTPAAARGRDIKWVVVLGSGAGTDADLPATSRLSRNGLCRVAEGIRVLRLNPHARLLMSGGAVIAGQSATGTVMADAARELGVDPARISIEVTSRDTEEEAVVVKRMVGDEPFVLVTSASHMPRSMMIFRNAGMYPIPAPADYWVKQDRSLYTLPGSGCLEIATYAVYEYLGTAWLWLRGKAG